MIRHVLLLVSFFLLISSSILSADQVKPKVVEPIEDLQIIAPPTPPNQKDSRDDIPLLGEESEAYLDEKQEALTSTLLSAAQWMDSFFDDPRYLSESNTTRAKVKLAFDYSRVDSFEFKPSIDLRLNVPNLERKLNILITANTDEDFDTDSTSTSGTSAAEKDDLSISLQYFMKQAESYNLSTSVGGSYDYLYAGIRYRYLQDFGLWQARFTDRLRYYTDDGWENKAELDLERHISTNWFFRSIFTVIVAEKEEGIPQSAVFRTYQTIDKDNALLYEVGTYYDTEPNYHLTDLQFKLRYRQRFYRDWLVLELQPYVTFPEDHDRETNPGFIGKLEFDFGYLANQTEYDTIFKF